ncbi:hypothetical protein GGI1_19289 [Acidithiobacillus sp. GGI-221]|nr:hypothetical protein GGI1_19289 [Acidithiobacillus sp. GGI-221]
MVLVVVITLSVWFFGALLFGSDNNPRQFSTIFAQRVEKPVWIILFA